MHQEVQVRVPATTANLGPGFDCLGVALRIFNTTRLVRGTDGENHAMAREAADAFFTAAKRRAFSFVHTIGGDVPISRGLGSSVTLRLGVLMGLNALCDEPLDRQRVFELCARLEGHPDNAAPAAFGGFCVASSDSVTRFRVASTLSFVLLVPPYEVRTSDARRALPREIPRAAAALSAGNACRITAAFATRDYAQLGGGAFGDGLHQPYRARLVPGMDAMIAAGTKAGALGGFLSGSGSTVACVTLERPAAVARAMLRAAGSGEARTLVTSADNRGARVLAVR